jgi:hypothetical protein
MRLTGATEAAQPRGAGNLRVRNLPRVLDGLPVSRSQEAREYGTVGKSNTERKLLHSQDDGAGADHARRVKVAT